MQESWGSRRADGSTHLVVQAHRTLMIVRRAILDYFSDDHLLTNDTTLHSLGTPELPFEPIHIALARCRYASRWPVKRAN